MEVLPNIKGVHLPAITKAKLMRQLLVKKERSFIQMLFDLGEWQTPRLNAHLFLKTVEKVQLSSARPKQSQCPEFLLQFK